MKRVLWMLMGVLPLFSCGCAPAAPPSPPTFAPTTLRSIPVQAAAPAEGSLYSAGRQGSLFSDFRARNVGDVVTVVVAENLKGSKNVSTQTSRDSDTTLGLKGIFGLDFEKRLNPRYAKNPGVTVDPAEALGGTTSDSFKGSGKTSRDASLSGTISARVVEVLPGGNLLIEGSRELKINNETQYLLLTGVIRPRDLSPDNTISSTRIADARVTYTGGGVLSEKQNPAWFARLLGLMAPF